VTGVSAVMIAYENEDASLTRLRRDLLPDLKWQAMQDDVELLVIDNSKEPLGKLEKAVRHYRGRYHWNGGANLKYGPALNQAVQFARYPHLLYVCSNHGEAREAGWSCDLLAAIDDPKVAMAGTLWPSGDPTMLGFPAGLPSHHVQGGVFAASRDVLLDHPYPDGPYAHYGADLVMCFQLMKAGYEIVDVPTIKSVWREDPGPGDWKYVHIGGTDAP
jgi:hypothetical protein